MVLGPFWVMETDKPVMEYEPFRRQDRSLGLWELAFRSGERIIFREILVDEFYQMVVSC